MVHTDFRIGVEFFTETGRWRCTDVGTRVVIAIPLSSTDPSWHNGPPYAVMEVVFDEHDLKGCHLDARTAGDKPGTLDQTM